LTAGKAEAKHPNSSTNPQALMVQLVHISGRILDVLLPVCCWMRAFFTCQVHSLDKAGHLVIFISNSYIKTCSCSATAGLHQSALMQHF